MRLAVKLGGFVVEGGFFKIRKAVGVCSNPRNDDGRLSRYHNLLLDFDGPLFQHPSFDWIEKTLSGFHAIVLGQFSVNRAVREMLRYDRVDTTHVLLGAKRGYWFLETFTLPPPEILHHVRCMEIERVAKGVRRVHRIHIPSGGNQQRRLFGLFWGK